MYHLLVSGGSDFKACRDSEIQEINVHVQPNKVYYSCANQCIHLAPWVFSSSVTLLCLRQNEESPTT